jgi:hypothetical protein
MTAASRLVPRWAVRWPQECCANGTRHACRGGKKTNGLNAAVAGCCCTQTTGLPVANDNGRVANQALPRTALLFLVQRFGLAPRLQAGGTRLGLGACSRGGDRLLSKARSTRWLVPGKFLWRSVTDLRLGRCLQRLIAPWRAVLAVLVGSSLRGACWFLTMAGCICTCFCHADDCV